MEINKTEAGLYSCEVDGLVYEWSMWQAEDAVDTLIDLAKVCGKSIAIMVDGIFIGSKDKEIPLNLMGQVFESLTQGLGDKALVKGLIKKLTSGEKVWCNGAKINFNTHYQNKLDHMFKVLRAGLEVQYGNFIAAVLGIMGIKLPKALTDPPKIM